MDPFFPILLGGIAVAAAGSLVWRYVLSPRAKRRRMLRNAVPMRVANAKSGALVKLVGKLAYVEGERPLAAPLTERLGAYYVVEVDQREGTGKTSHWVQIIHERATHQQIWLVDLVKEDQRVLVDLGAAEVELVMDGRFSSGVFNDASPRLEAFLCEYRESSKGWIFNKTLRYSEGVLEEGERVAVLGRCISEPDPDPRAASSQGGYRSAPTRLRIVPPREHALLVTDDPKLCR